MAKRTRFVEYKDRYANYRFELSEEGIRLMQCHIDDFLPVGGGMAPLDRAWDQEPWTD